MYVVILAGGGGTRLWPLSRPERPKPFLPLLGEGSLLQRTVRRLEPLVDAADVTVVTEGRYVPLVREQLPGVRAIAEPMGRNTAAAIALAASVIDRPEDEVMMVLPADHSIAREETFVGVLEGAARLAEGSFEIEEPLVTLGIQPTHASTDFGYLVPDIARGARVAGLEAYPLRAFEEKPHESRARELFEIPGVAWNAGMFVWRRRAILAALERYTSLMTVIGPAASSELALRMAYERVHPTSIDYAVMEGAAGDHRVVMAAMDVGWSDLGNWTAILEALAGPAGTSARGRVVQSGDRVVLGPDDLLVHAVDGHLEIAHGPQDRIAIDGPSAHLSDAAPLEPAVAALIARVERDA
jgi:mannose-1-phosphate guanylyltransferase